MAQLGEDDFDEDAPSELEMMDEVEEDLNEEELDDVGR